MKNAEATPPRPVRWYFALGAVVAFALIPGVVGLLLGWLLGQKPTENLRQSVFMSIGVFIFAMRGARRIVKSEWPEWLNESLWLAVAGAGLGLYGEIVRPHPWWWVPVISSVWGWSIGYFVILSVAHPLIIFFFKKKQPALNTGVGEKS